jgi:hypothetical protein
MKKITNLAFQVTIQNDMSYYLEINVLERKSRAFVKDDIG